MGSNIHQKQICKIKLSKEKIEAYRQRDRESHRKRRQGMPNIGEVEASTPPISVISSEEEIEYANVENDIGNENENGDIYIENVFG